MMPIDLLMTEHRLIERLIPLMKTELKKIENNKLDLNFINNTIDFLITYADKCHHGKEEGILFKQLTTKKLSPEHQKTMEELISEHNYARNNVRRIIDSQKKYVLGNKKALEEIKTNLHALMELYPIHIRKEDKQFFNPSMD